MAKVVGVSSVSGQNEVGSYWTNSSNTDWFILHKFDGRYGMISVQTGLHRTLGDGGILGSIDLAREITEATFGLTQFCGQLTIEVGIS